MPPRVRAKPPGQRRRRTQAERSQAMRQRLLEATLESLAEDGYAGTTMSSIVRRAGVSRGAQVHHYPHKQALILDAAEDLLRRIYRTLGRVMLDAADESRRLQAVVEGAWEQLFAGKLYFAYLELLIESHRDPKLAASLRELLGRVSASFDAAAEHYFERTPGGHEDLRALFLQVSCLMAGLAAQAHLFPHPGVARSQRQLWLRQAAALLRAKKGVRTPPPVPGKAAVV
jgi:AcrR family transcriptional regulator